MERHRNVEEGIEYAKVPLDVWEIAESLPNVGQQKTLIFAYVRYFYTGEPGDVPKSILPAWIAVKAIADRIKTGILTGGKRARRNKNGIGGKSATTQREVHEKSGSSPQLVGSQSTTSQKGKAALPADCSDNPTTYPPTPYIYTDKHKHTYTHQHQEPVLCGVQEEDYPY